MRRGILVILLVASSLSCDRSKGRPPSYTPTDSAAYVAHESADVDISTEERLMREAEALLAAGQPEKAIERIDDGMSELLLFDFPPLWAVRGKAYQQLGDVENAAASYLMAIELGLVDALVYAAFADLLATHAVSTEDRRAAIEHYRAAIALDPDVVAWHRGLARMLLDLGENEQALEVLADARRLGIDAKTEQLLALAYERTGDPQQGLLHATRALEKDPEAGDQVEFRLLRARLLLDTGGVDGALEELDQAVILAPDSREVRLEFVRAAMKAGKPAAALMHVQWLEAQSPRDTSVLVLHGEVLLALGKTDDAILRFKAALIGDPSLDEPRLLTIEALVAEKRCKAAKEAFGDLEANTADPAALIAADGLLGPCK